MNKVNATLKFPAIAIISILASLDIIKMASGIPNSYPVYQDTIPDDGVLPPVATDTPPLATDTPPLVEGSPSSVCNVNIPQDQVLDVRDTPSGDNVVSTLENGTDVAIVDQQQTWVLIKLIDPNNPAGLFVPNNPDNLGWVLQDYIQCGSDPQ
jgi:hypothetical protein